MSSSDVPLPHRPTAGPATRRLIRIENALQQRVEYESLVYRLQNHFANLPPQYLDWGIEEALSAMGEFCRLEQAHSFRIMEGKVDHGQEWSSDGQATTMQQIKSRPLDQLMPWAAARLRRGDSLAIYAVSQLGDAAAYEKIMLTQAGIRSAMFVPILVRNDLAGFLMLGSTTREIHWDGDAVTLLKMAAGEISDLYERQRAEARQAQLVGILEATADCVAIVEKSSQRISYMNQAGRQMIGIEPQEDLTPWRIAHILPPWVMQLKQQHVWPEVHAYGSWTGESAIVTRDGREIPVSESITKIPGLTHDGEENHAYIFRDISEQRRLEKEVLDISEREQSRFGHDLHDGLGQHLTGVQFMAQVLQQKLEDKQLEPYATEAGEIAALIRQAITLTRDLARSLSPVAVQSKTLQDALEDLCAGITRRGQATCVGELDDDIAVTHSEAAIQLYRIAQEAVNNALKHGQASRITVSLGHDDLGQVALEVSDNGKGFPEGTTKGMGMGLRVMKHRAALIGGSLEIMARPGETVVMCTVDEERLNPQTRGPRAEITRAEE